MSDSKTVLENEQSVISIKEARKLLGKDGTNLTDEQIEKIIEHFSAITKTYFQTRPKY